MTTLSWLYDGLIALTLVWIAWRALTTAELFRSVVLFIAFGLLMALAWVRLHAPDIALAEAAIGAGLTGALLLDAVGHLQARRATDGKAD
jgi:energy-converting hydrogenase B subunit D